jgi:RNA polymerase sigma-70 factor (ECF subfamily)
VIGSRAELCVDHEHGLGGRSDVDPFKKIERNAPLDRLTAVDTNRSAALAAPSFGVTEADRSVAFNAMIELHLTESYRLAAVLLRDRVEAEDATHDAVVRAWDRWGQLRNPDRFRAWFQQILVNGCRERLRRRAQGVREIAMQADFDHMAPRRHEESDETAITGALQRLSPDHQVVVALRFYLDLSVEEIASRTNARTGTVKSRLHYALRALRAAYEAQDR